MGHGNSHRQTVAADGAAAGNPGPGGWAWYVDDGTWASGGEGRTTNNRMELTAVIDALENLDGPLHIICDSRYVVDSATKWRHGWKKRGWRKPDGSEIANKDLIIKLDAALVGRDIKFEWVRGHDGHHLNEQADMRARAAAEAVRDGRRVDSGRA
jgi:ribonuclease HI